MIEKRESFLIHRVMERTTDARLALETWDHETVMNAAQSLLACAAQMRKMKPESVVDYRLACVESLDIEPSDDGNAPVESDRPDPTRPPGGVQVQINERDVVAVRNGSGLPVFEEDEADADPQQADDRPEVLPEPGSQAELIAMLEA